MAQQTKNSEKNMAKRDKLSKAEETEDGKGVEGGDEEA